MFHQPYEKLLEQQKDQLDQISHEITDPQNKMTAALNRIQANLIQCRKGVLENSFDSQEEEIYFFKHVKPRLNADKILAVEQFNLIYNRPVADREELRNYYETELKHFERFFKNNAFYYHYYKSGRTELDKLYFIRGTTIDVGFLQELPGHEPEFSTALDYLFSQFIAYGQMQQIILDQIKLLYEPVELVRENSVKGLKWTGDSINLVEVAYGIWLTGQVNDGNASISEIVRWLEKCFSLNIGRAHRRWTEISQRKRSSYTKFIDRMQETISERIDNELGIKG